MNVRPRFLGVLTLALAAALGAGCTVTPANPPETQTEAAAQMERDVDATLQRLWQMVPGSKALTDSAAGVLVFPRVLRGSFVVGGAYGSGALREMGRTTGYYKTTAGSVGMQAGGQSRAVIYVFNTAQALAQFKASSGWTAGADATVAAGNVGANGVIDTTSKQQAVTSFVLTNAGLEAGAAVGAAKIWPSRP